MTTAKVKREAMHTPLFRYRQAERNTQPPAHWCDLKMIQYKTQAFASLGGRNFIGLIRGEAPHFMSRMSPFSLIDASNDSEYREAV